jgi:large subunit ribosomal protein L21
VYAVIKTGGKQYKVAPGDVLPIELLGQRDGEVSFAPLLVVDGEQTLTGAALAGATVAGRIVAEAKGPKITGFTYKAKARARRRWGHRQRYTVIQITGIAKGEISGIGRSEMSGSAGAETSGSGKE